MRSPSDHPESPRAQLIENALRSHPGIHDLVVMVLGSDQDDQTFAACIVPNKDYLDVLAKKRPEVRRIDEWRAVFDQSQKGASLSKAGLNIRGWTSSYTKKPIPDDEMLEWIDSTVSDVLSLHPSEILEIGCGTGLLLLRLAATSTRYVGVDFSSPAMKSLKGELDTLGEMSGSVTLLEGPADDFRDFDNCSFDTIIINSVLQYFPSLQYLIRVLEGALKVTKPNGAIFIGDVRSLPLLEAFSASVELFQAPDRLRLSELRERIRRRLNHERELVISPAYFLALQRFYPRVSKVEIRPKWGNSDNEMTRFRYNVTLFLDSVEREYLEPCWLDWTIEGLTLDKIRDRLRLAEETIAIKGVVNARLEKDIETLACLANFEDSSTVGDLKEALNSTPPKGVTPDQLRSLATQFNYQTEISWAACRSDGSFDVVFHRLSADGKTSGTAVAWPQPETIYEDLSLYVHDPSQIARRRILLRQLHDFANAKLPESMVPAEFILVDALPLTSEGEIDRDALSTQSYLSGGRPRVSRAD